MSWPRALTRARALRLAASAAIGTAVCAVLVGALAKMAAPLQGDGAVAGFLAVLILLLSVAALIGILVLMYAFYALIRGPTTGPDA